MKTIYPLRITSIFPVVLLLLIMVTACKEPDIKLVNKVKNFNPRWSALNEKLSHLDRNLSIAEKRFEQDFSEIEGMLGQIADSLKGRNYRGMLDDYKVIIADRDTIRMAYTAHKQTYVEAVDRFNSWEKEVMDGDIEAEAGLAELKEYKALHKDIELEVDSMTTSLEQMFGRHNSVLRELSEMMGIYTNYDIKIQ